MYISMKATLPILALFSISAIWLSAQGKPTGILGTDAVSLNYSYYNDDLSYYKESDYNCVGYGIALNKSVLDAERFGVDANLRCYYATNVSYKNEFKSDQNSVEGGATVFMKGAIRPFLSGSVYFHHMETDYKGADHDTTDNSCALEAKGGVEVQFMEGFSGRAFVVDQYDCDDDTSPQNTARYGVDAMYWFNDTVALSLGESYMNYNHIDRYTTSVSIFYHF